MSDLIDRQKAITAIFDLCGEADTENPHIDAIEEVLGNLPSACNETKQQATISSDCISRQELINWLSYIEDHCLEEYAYGYHKTRAYVEQMPSAEQCMTATSNTMLSDTVKIPVMDGTTKRLPSASTELSNNSPKLDNENGELISRKDAIDAINAYLGLSAVSRTIQNMTSIQEILENLPSAEPERWSTCFDCPLSHGCPIIKGCTNEQAMQYAGEIPDDCPLNKISAEPERKKGKWIPIWEDDPNTFPPVDKEGYSDYVLLSFSNYSGLIIGQYRVDEDGGAFYAGDDEEPLTVHDLYVNAWQPLPSPYQEEGEEE